MDKSGVIINMSNLFEYFWNFDSEDTCSNEVSVQDPLRNETLTELDASDFSSLDAWTPSFDSGLGHLMIEDSMVAELNNQEIGERGLIEMKTTTDGAQCSESILSTDGKLDETSSSSETVVGNKSQTSAEDQVTTVGSATDLALMVNSIDTISRRLVPKTSSKRRVG